MCAIGLPLLFFRSVWHILKSCSSTKFAKIELNWPILICKLCSWPRFFSVLLFNIKSKKQQWIEFPVFCNRFFRSNIFNWIFLSCNDSKWTVRIQIILPKFEITSDLNYLLKFSFLFNFGFFFSIWHRCAQSTMFGRFDESGHHPIGR